jgi:uncharacterized OsmC-like protein
MTSEKLKSLQTPLKAAYRDDPGSARLALSATASLDGFDVVAHVPTHTGPVEAGLHPAAGGDGSRACAGTMLLEALVACAGVTLEAVATAMNLPTLQCRITAEGELDMRGTMGIDRATPIGFSSIRLTFDLPSIESPAQREKLIELTERYCVVYQTLKHSPQMQSIVAEEGEELE